jgi:rare lipoprotein A
MTFTPKPFLLAASLLSFLPMSTGIALANSNSNAPISELTEIQEIASNPSPTTEKTIDTLATTFSYSHQNETATTLYVNRLPVLTFANPSDAPANAAEAIANQVSTTINTLATAPDFDAEQISVSWKAGNQYQLLYANQAIATLNDTVYLADTTDNPEQDALIAANRLRRLLGGADPVATIQNKPQSVAQPQLVATSSRVVKTMQGHASWYGPGFHGRRTANGERFDQNGFTAAHKTLPFGTKVKVTNINNGQSVVVRINDRGPFIRGREIDLAKGAAQQIGLVSSGVANVRLEVLGN